MALVARHRGKLLALADAMTACCEVLGDVFVQNIHVRWVDERFLVGAGELRACAA